MMKKIIFLGCAISSIFSVVFATDSGQKNGKYNFNGSISKEVLENYLEKSLTYQGLLMDKDKKRNNKDIECVLDLGAKFIGRAIYRWGGESEFNDPNFLKIAKERIEKIHAKDPEIIIQGCAFEAVTVKVSQVKIPKKVFEALGLPYEDRNFDYNKMMFDDGKFNNQWGKGSGVPDITKEETKLWFMFLISSYVDIGVEAIHLGQVNFMGRFDKNWENWQELMESVRIYCSKNARRKFVIFDAHTPKGGMVNKDGLSLLDFNSFPLRIKGDKDDFTKGTIEIGRMDSIYKKSKGCKTPSGWSCKSLPYLVEIDNFGVSNPGTYKEPDYFIWGYDEITWFYLIGKEKRIEFIKYVYNWLKQNDPIGHFEFPGSRGVYINGKYEIANIREKAEDNPYGFGVAETMKEIWKSSKL